jgi:hypothetical protein
MDLRSYTIAMLRPVPALRVCVIAGAATLAVAIGAFDGTIRAQVAPRLEIALEPVPASTRARVTAAANESMARYTEWLGPLPADRMTLPDLDLPWWPDPQSMDVESQVAFGLARQWWSRWLGDPRTAPIANGLAWYLQSRVVEGLYNVNFHVRGHSGDGVRYFGGAVPRPFPLLSLDRWSAGLGRGEFVSAGTSWPNPSRRLPSDFDATVARGALAFGTIERLVGWPALQGALRALAGRSAGEVMDRNDIASGLGAALGQDLSWFLDAAFDPAQSFDYAIRSVTTSMGSCASGPCHRTEVVVSRDGTATFSGAPAEAAAYESGDAMELQVGFADGQVVSARWDGRSTTKAFTFEGPAPFAFARLDPDRVVLLDRNYLDNQYGVAHRADVPMVKWIARWLVWLQDASLSYGFLF